MTATLASANQGVIYVLHRKFIAEAPKSRPLVKQIVDVSVTGLATLAALLSPFWVMYQLVSAKDLLHLLLQALFVVEMISITYIGYYLSGIGITFGYHRLETHGALKTHRWIEVLLVLLGSTAAQGKVIQWIVNHYIHHLFTDIVGFDPHTPKEGWLHAHWTWVFTYPTPGFDHYAKRWLQNPVIARTSHWYVFLPCVIFPFALGYLIAGWNGLYWLGFVRLGFLYHATWAVNSESHRAGKRRYNTNDLSTNNPLVAFIGLGEGGHNNHHAFPSDPFHGYDGESDATGGLIRQMAKRGLVWDLQTPSFDQREAMRRSLLDRVN